MPRGKRKKAQFALKLWSPKGGHVSFHTERDLTDDEWKQEVLENLERLRRYVEAHVPAHEKAGVQ